MAVTKMKLVKLIGPMSQLDAALEKCVAGGDFHLDQAMSFFSASQGFTPINEENPYTQLIARFGELTAQTKFSPVESGVKDYSIEEINRYASHLSDKLASLQAQRRELSAELDDKLSLADRLGHFKGLDLDLKEIFDCKYIKVRFGRLPKESLDKMKQYNDNPYIIYFPCTNDGQYVWGVYFSPLDNQADVDRVFASLYFERMMLPEVSGTPEQAAASLEKEAEEIKARLESIGAEIDKVWEQEGEQCSSVVSYLGRRSAAFDLRRYVASFKDSFVAAGWIPAAREDEIKRSLESLPGVECTFERAEEDEGHSPPVKLKNFKPFRPFEMYVEMYGLPSYREVDPTPFVAITYFLIFGIMFADVGQGLCLALVGWLFMWKMLKMKLGKILVPCGISSAIFGFLFGSVFGFETALNPLWTRLGFNFEHGKPIEVMDSPITVLLATMGIGVLLVIIAMLINIYSCLKQRHLGKALLGNNGLAGLVFYAGLLGGLAAQLLLGKKVFTTPYIIGVVVIPLILIFLSEPLGELLEGKKDWMPKKIGDFLIQNIFEMMEYMLSYISNTLSFMRVGAFIFIHIGMMQVVFALAGVTEGSPLSVGSIIVLVLGNIFVMAMEGLLVGIQSLRLEFYELFSRFFEGSGRPFIPVRIKDPVKN
ncbi:MAG: ATPase [Clostridia bacterium]|nr:ATPase [Clostridia bacterium]